MTNVFEDFLPDVMPYVPGCPEVVAVSAIRNAAIEFCMKSLWLVNNPATLVSVANQAAYAPVLPTDTELAAVDQVTYNASQLNPVGEVDVTYLFQSPGVPQYFTQIDPVNVQLLPMPQSAGVTIRMVVALTPTKTATTCDSNMFERWGEGIGYGARARLHAIPGQPFSSPDESMRCRQMFSTAIGGARIERNRGFTRTVLRVRPPTFV
jgi:hypothetical protein